MKDRASISHLALTASAFLLLAGCATQSVTPAAKSDSLSDAWRIITANGHESMDTDLTPDMKSGTWLLHHGHWQIEVMANLDQVPAHGALIVVAWPKPKGGLGFPVRAFAILP